MVAGAEISLFSSVLSILSFWDCSQCPVHAMTLVCITVMALFVYMPFCHFAFGTRVGSCDKFQTAILMHQLNTCSLEAQEFTNITN